MDTFPYKINLALFQNTPNERANNLTEDDIDMQQKHIQKHIQVLDCPPQTINFPVFFGPPEEASSRTWEIAVIAECKKIDLILLVPRSQEGQGCHWTSCS